MNKMSKRNANKKMKENDQPTFTSVVFQRLNTKIKTEIITWKWILLKKFTFFLIFIMKFDQNELKNNAHFQEWNAITEFTLA